MAEPGDTLPPVLIALMKGVVYQDDDPARWQSLLHLQARVRDFAGILGLELLVDEAEGYAYLRQRDPQEGEDDVPRLVPRRALSYPVSLLLALLRKKLAEFDATSAETRLILGRDDIVESYRVFLAEASDEVRQLDRFDAHLKRVVDMGFLRPLARDREKFEVRRILKAFVDAQWLSLFAERLEAYRQHALGGQGSGGKEAVE